MLQSFVEQLPFTRHAPFSTSSFLHIYLIASQIKKLFLFAKQSFFQLFGPTNAIVQL